MNHRTSNQPRAGFTLIEASLSISMLAGLLYVFFQSFAGFQRLGKQSEALYSAAAEAARAMGTIRRDLEHSGFIEIGGENFPMFFDAGDPPAGFPGFAHPDFHPISGVSMESPINALPVPVGGAGLPGFTPEQQPQCREVIYTLPADVDGNGWPEVAAGAPVWNGERFGFLLIPEADGNNLLVRRSESGQQAVLARGVRAFRVDPPVDTGFTIPLDSVRVWVQLVRDSGRGGVQLFNRVDVIQLRNGGLAP